MAEIALVSDISGVCSSRETLRITPSPMNVASMKTNSSDVNAAGDPSWAGASDAIAASSGGAQSIVFSRSRLAPGGAGNTR